MLRGLKCHFLIAVSFHFIAIYLQCFGVDKKTCAKVVYPQDLLIFGSFSRYKLPHKLPPHQNKTMLGMSALCILGRHKTICQHIELVGNGTTLIKELHY